MAPHSALPRTPEHAPLLAALRAGAPLPDARLEQLRQFARALLLRRGRVTEATWLAFEQAGFTRPQALEVVLGVAAYVASTLLNIVTDAPLDAAFTPFAWQATPEFTAA